MTALAGWIERLKAQGGFVGFLLAGFLGALGVLGHAPFHVWPAFAVSITGLMVLLDGATLRPKPLRSGFSVAWSWAFGYFFAGMFWVGDAFLVDAEKFALLMPAAVTALPAGLAMFWGFAGIAYAKFWRGDAVRLLIFAIVFGVAEFARGHLLTGLPWNLPAYIWKPGGIISQTSAIIGPYGLSIGTMLVLALPAVIGTRANQKAVTALAACLLIVSAGFGGLRLQGAGKVDPMAGNGPLISAGQGGFTQKEVWDPANAMRVTQTYLDLLDHPDAQKSDIVVWPEGTFPFLLAEQPEVMGVLDRKIGNRTLVVGSIRREMTATPSTYWNSIFVFDKTQGPMTQRAVYDKYHLVPFGEYLPFRPVFKAMGIASLVAYDGEMTPGSGPSVLPVTGAPSADPRICYEIVFPYFNPKANGKAGWILNVSIDAWFGDLLGPDQHYAQARSRAIETGMPLVRAASGGWSAVIDRYGRPLAEHQKGPGYAFARLPLDARGTPYGRYGEVFFALFLIILLGLSLFPHHKSVDFRDRLDDEA